MLSNPFPYFAFTTESNHRFSPSFLVFFEKKINFFNFDTILMDSILQTIHIILYQIYNYRISFEIE
jgi:hypothetical protein